MVWANHERHGDHAHVIALSPINVARIEIRSLCLAWPVPDLEREDYLVGGRNWGCGVRVGNCGESLRRAACLLPSMMFKRVGLVLGFWVTGCLSRPLTEVSPSTSNLFVDQIQQSAVDKIDLLFMVDNSVSMTDKQEILKDAVPVLLSRLVFPMCVDGAGKPTGVSALANGQCPDQKGQPEFNPIGDIHIGIVSSSLGAHGGVPCAKPAVGLENVDDRAHLVGSMRPDRFPVARTWNNSGFLAWDSAGLANQPAGTSDAKSLNGAFQDMIAAIGEHGCGYEASLESWYRFLVDPEPPASVTQIGNLNVRSSKLTLNADGSAGPCLGCDEALLAQRKAFLRPDSLVAIVMLSDENDCSIRDDSAGWLVGSSGPLQRATSQCDANPNDPCCRYCGRLEPDGPPRGCSALADDTACKNPWGEPHDSINLRCFDQRRRFGFDLLYETSRYVDALTKTTLPLQSTPGKSVKNPLFDGGASGRAPRDPSLVFLAGIVGVPWQDIADDASLTGAGLTYLTAKELTERGRWRALLGDPSATPPLLPSDPFMVETPNVRSGRNAIAGVSISAVTSVNPRENPINGHEQNIPDLDDLQYACTFPLKTPKVCGDADWPSCDCAPKVGDSSAVVRANSPLCQGGATINTQTFGKAYPGTRQLSVLQGVGENAIVASICPKVIAAADPMNPSADPNYGYNPAVSAILTRLKSQLAGKCLPRKLEADDQGHVPCRVVEAQKEKQACDCAAAGRAEVASDDVKNAVRAQLSVTKQCDGPGQKPCADWCMCEIERVDAAHLQACQANQGGVPPGYCYLDDQAKVGADASTAQLIETQLALCPANQRNRLRFVDSDPAHKTPAQGAVAFIACLGAAFPAEQ